MSTIDNIVCGFDVAQQKHPRNRKRNGLLGSNPDSRALLCRNVSDVCGDDFTRVDPEEQSKWCQSVPPKDIRQ